MKKIGYKFLLFYLWFIVSCSNKNKIELGLEGYWSIDEIYYKDYNLSKCMMTNLIYFSFDEQSILPFAGNNCYNALNDNFESKGTVEIINSEVDADSIPYRLKINTKNKLFSGTHKIIFSHDDKRQMLLCEIISDKFYLLCRKGYFKYDKILIKKLEELSWKTRPR